MKTNTLIKKQINKTHQKLYQLWQLFNTFCFNYFLVKHNILLFTVHFLLYLSLPFKLASRSLNFVR